MRREILFRTEAKLSGITWSKVKFAVGLGKNMNEKDN